MRNNQDQELQIRQFAFHSHNANRVWPGTFNLAEYLLRKSAVDCTDDEGGKQKTYRHFWGSVLEIGTATGLLAIRMASASVQHRQTVTTGQDDVTQSEQNNAACSYVVTSDVLDEEGDVEANVAFNFKLNKFDETCRPLHIPHTWGTGWKESVSRQLDTAKNSTNNNSLRNTPLNLETLLRFDTIVASDILLYVSAYDALVETLLELMPMHDDNQPDSQSTQFVMSWNRRMKESAAFFDKMKLAGFDVTHEGKCVYTFVRRRASD
jgi:hypothetical protein